MKDKAAFRNVVPFLEGGEREWLRTSLELTSPKHPWIVEL
jgi:hypothetical protein